MLCKQSAPVLIAACTLGALIGAPAGAADLTIAPGAKNAATTARARLGAKEKHALAKTGKDRRPDKERHRKIVTYKLFHDPVFKLGGAVTDKRPLGGLYMHNVAGLGTGYSLTGGQVSSPVVGGLAGSAINAEESGGAGIAFGCREKPLSTSPARREMTACYGHKLDKSWKSQTYVLKEFSEGRQNWGGGLLLGYAY